MTHLQLFEQSLEMEAICHESRVGAFQRKRGCLRCNLRKDSTQSALAPRAPKPPPVFFLAGKQSFLDGANCQRRALHDFLRQRLYFPFELRCGDDVIDDAETQRSLRVDHVPGVKKLSRFRWANELRQEIGAAKIGKQAYFGEILTECRFFGGDSSVRGQRDVHSCTCRGAI